MNIPRDANGRFIEGYHYSLKTEFKKGNIPWTKDKKLPSSWIKGLKKETDVRVKNISIKQKGQHHSSKTEFKKGHTTDRKKLSEIRKNLFLTGKIIPFWKGKHISETTKKKLRIANLGKHYPEETIQKHKRSSELLWQDPEYHERQLKAMFKGLLKRPTSLEKQFIEFIEKYSLPYKYTGNGSFLINYRNPDFININGEKICIETRPKILCKIWDKCSPEEYEKRMKEHYIKWGWECIVLFADRNKNETQWVFEKSIEEIIKILSENTKPKSINQMLPL